MKKITRKVISKVREETAKVPEPAEVEVEKGVRRRVCFFCQSKTSPPSYTDTAVLRRFLSDRAKIVPKLRTNLCSRHQRAVTRQIKYARHLALLPFVPKV